MKKHILCLLIILSIFSANIGAKNQTNEKYKDKVIVGYVTSWGETLPDPTLATHYNYAFGHVKDSFDGVRIDNPQRLQELVRLKENNPDIRILLSIGGWGSGNFSEMAASDSLRNKFAEDCGRIIEEFDLDGIDIDWEYPTVGAAGISSSPEDTSNFTKLMKEIRAQIGEDKLLTIATVSNARYINFTDILPYVDFVNIMAYDMGWDNKHHASLFPSPISGEITASEAIDYHLKAGVPNEKLVLGMPFYGRSSMNDYRLYKNIRKSDNEEEVWDSIGKVPYFVDKKGNFTFGFDNVKSIKEKVSYALGKGLKGVMYWETDGDDDANNLSSAIASTIKEKICAQVPKDSYPASYAKGPRFKALLYYSENVEDAHVDFANDAIDFFKRLNFGDGFILDVTQSLKPYNYETLKEYSVIISLNISPSENDERELFEKYMENGGGWIGFHAAGYNDKNTHWPWFNEFLGCGYFYCNNWPPQPALIEINLTDTPVTTNLPQSFVLPESEFYQWNPSPVENPDVEIYASLSPKNYPLGIKDIIYSGDFPIIWKNKKYRMMYVNYGHGDREFSDAAQNLLTLNIFRYIVSLDPSGNPFLPYD